jgi:hypothetical protein
VAPLRASSIYILLVLNVDRCKKEVQSRASNG